VAYYPFNGNAYDESGNANHGNIYGATLTTDRKGKANSAYSFDGVSSYISVSNSNSLCPTSALTVSAWVYADDLDHRHIIVAKRINLNTFPYNSYLLASENASSTQTWTAGISTNSYEIAIKNSPIITPNIWYHLLLTYDGSTLSFYVNGVLANSQAKSGNISYSSMDLFIGTDALNAHYLKGKIDDIRIYNRVLSANEIQALYNE